MQNRFRLDEGGVEPERTIWALNDGAADETVLLDEPYARRRGSRRFRLIAFGGLALLLLLSIGAFVYFRFMREGAGDEANQREQAFQRLEETLQDRYYIPDGPFSPALNHAVELYRNLERDAARRAFDGVVTSASPDQEKAIALVYLAVMAMEQENLELARHHLLRALKYNREFIPALVNLAIVERKAGAMAEARGYAQQARELAPNDPKVALLLGNILAEGQDLNSAIGIYREGIASSPEEPLLYYNLALSLLRQQKYDEALLNFARAIEKAGASQIAVQSYAQMGQIYFYKGNLEMAADNLRKAAAMAPDNGRYRYNLGVVYLRMNRAQEAAAEFQRSLDAGVNDVSVYRALSRAFLQMRQPALATRALEKALYLNPDDSTTLFQLGDLYYDQRDLLKAADVFKRIVNTTPGDRNTEDALLKLAAVQMDLERSNEAIDTLERAAGLNPSNGKVYYLLGMVYDRAGRRALAVESWKKALNRGGAAVQLERSQERQIRLAMADVYRREGAYDMALAEFRKIAERNQQAPTIAEDAQLDLEVGKTYLDLRDFSNAARALERAAQAADASAEQRKEAYLRLAQAYAATGQSADLENARANANRAARLDPADQRARLLQASILVQTESLVDREKAIELLKEVAQSDVDAKTAAQAYNLLGVAYMKNGEYRRALGAFDQAVQLDPSNNEAYQNQRAAANAYERNL
ncbi:MAG: tetratricopeptide repeat protein [Leptospirales bacterium]|nr:tetratricopeptide repeat protein [Leptospirales bacterium]